MLLTVECSCDQTSWGDCVAIVGSAPTLGKCCLLYTSDAADE